MVSRPAPLDCTTLNAAKLINKTNRDNAATTNSPKASSLDSKLERRACGCEFPK